MNEAGGGRGSSAWHFPLLQPHTDGCVLSVGYAWSSPILMLPIVVEVKYNSNKKGNKSNIKSDATLLTTWPEEVHVHGFQFGIKRNILCFWQQIVWTSPSQKLTLIWLVKPPIKALSSMLSAVFFVRRCDDGGLSTFLKQLYVYGYCCS